LIIISFDFAKIQQIIEKSKAEIKKCHFMILETANYYNAQTVVFYLKRSIDDATHASI